MQVQGSRFHYPLRGDCRVCITSLLLLESVLALLRCRIPMGVC